MEGAVLVGIGHRKKAFGVPEIGLKCDSRENPLLLDGGKLDHWWIAASCIFAGDAHPPLKAGGFGDPKTYKLDGPATFAVGNGLFVGILAPMSPKTPSLWWSWPLSSIKVTAHEGKGMLKKRPGKIQVDRGGGVDGEGDTLLLSTISEMIFATKSFTSYQEEAFVAALDG